MGNYRLLLQPHFNQSSPLLPSVSVQFPDDFRHSEIAPHGGDLFHFTWRKNNSVTNLSWRLSYNFRDEQLFTDDGGDQYDGFRFGGASKKRAWWLDDDEEYDSDSDSDSYSWEFGGSRNEFPIFKVISALGWMVPAFVVSMIVGTDQNALVALAVPLVQTAVSVVVDKLWAYDRPRTKSWVRTRRKPFNGGGSTRTQTRERKEQEVESRTGNGSGNGYQSWVSSDNGSSHSEEGTQFGGWDELDREKSEARRPRTNKSVPNRGRKAEYGSRKQGNRVRMNKTRRVRDRPLLIRLLVSVFPFMSSWSSFLL